MEARYALFTDIDHTMLGRERLARGIPEAVEILSILGVPIIPVTAKSIAEIVATGPLLGLPQENIPFIAIAESGAAIYATPNVLPYIDGSITIDNIELEYVILSENESLESISKATLRAFKMAGCNITPRSVSEMSPDELSNITKLPPYLAKLIPTHNFLVIFYMPHDACKRRAAIILEAEGYYVGIGRNFIHVGRHRGKAYAVRWIKLNVPLLMHAHIVALGDSAHDKEMLEIADTAIVIPPEKGPPLRLARGDYLIAPYPAPEGWIWAAHILSLNTPPRK